MLKSRRLDNKHDSSPCSDEPKSFCLEPQAGHRILKRKKGGSPDFQERRRIRASKSDAMRGSAGHEHDDRTQHSISVAVRNISVPMGGMDESIRPATASGDSRGSARPSVQPSVIPLFFSERLYLQKYE